MKLNAYIEHTNLNLKAKSSDIITLCKEAVDNGFYGVCVHNKYIKLALDTIQKYKKHDQVVKIITVVNFPSGKDDIGKIEHDTVNSIGAGADEIDLVINKNALSAGDYRKIQSDIETIVSVVNKYKKIVKVIIEAAELDKKTSKRIIHIVKKSGAHFVKTSTGTSPKGGAAYKDITLIKSVVKDKLGIKAAGGITTPEKALNMVYLGATRIGSSKSLDLLKEPAFDSDRFQHAWDWFKYHAEQRYKSFHFYLIILGALLYAIFNKNVTAALKPGLAVIGAIFSFIFMVFDYRNEELVNNGKIMLQKAQDSSDIPIISLDKTRQFLRHKYLLKLVLFICFAAFVIVAAYCVFSFQGGCPS